MKSNYTWSAFDSKELLAQNLALKILHELSLAIEKKGYASVAFSGGSTPKKLFETLSRSVFAWEKVRVTLVDERWVDASSAQSNEKLIKDNLLQNEASKATFIALMSKEESAKDALEALQKTLHDSIEKLDVVVLGMGEDAHTASFFPNAPELEFALSTKESCCATTANAQPKERMTLSRHYLLQATTLILHIEGKNKKNIFMSATNSDDTTTQPIISMMQQTNPILEVYYAE